MAHKLKRRVISFSELRRLSICNSRKLPNPVDMEGKRMRWVGIGSAEIRKALEDLAKELGGEWKEERHLVRNQHHHHGGVDHHVHQK